MDGALIGTPAFDDDRRKIPKKLRDKFDVSHVVSFDRVANGLKPVRVDMELGMVFVNVDGQAPSLQDWLGNLLDDLSEYQQSWEGGKQLVMTEHTKTYRTNANWKLLYENFLEYYHLPAVHPGLCPVSGVDEHARRQGKGQPFVEPSPGLRVVAHRNVYCFRHGPADRRRDPRGPACAPAIPRD